MNQTESSTSAPLVDKSANSNKTRLAVLQFARRATILLAGYLILSLMLGVLGQANAPRAGNDAAAIIADSAGISAGLAGTGIALSLCIVPIGIAVGLALLRMTARNQIAQGFIRTVGRWWFHLQIVWQPLVAIFTILIFLVGILHLPLSLRDGAAQWIFGALVTALMPSAVVTLTILRTLGSDVSKAGRRWLLSALLSWGQYTFGMTAVWLAAQLFVEFGLGIQGIGMLLLQAVGQSNSTVAFGVAGALALLVLVGRIVGEVFGALRLAIENSPDSLSTVDPETQVSTTRWSLIGLAALIIPMCAVLASLIQPVFMSAPQSREIYDPVVGFDYSTTHPSRPSPDHLLGTDPIGRDILSQVMFSGAPGIMPPLVAAFVALLLGMVLGGISGIVAALRTQWSEWVSDLILLPAEIMLLLPPIAVLLLFATGEAFFDAITLIPLLAFVLAPRIAYAYRSLWVRTSVESPRNIRLVVGPAALLLGAAFVGLWNAQAMSFLGFVFIRMSWGIMIHTAITEGYIEGITWGAAAWIACMLGFLVAMDTLQRRMINTDMLFHLSR